MAAIEANIQATQKHIDKAIAACGEGQPLTRCCIIYQALVGAGLDVDFVHNVAAILKGTEEYRISFDNVAVDVAGLSHISWPKVKPFTFKVWGSAGALGALRKP
jgi:hypothetical protein